MPALRLVPPCIWPSLNRSQTLPFNVQIHIGLKSNNIFDNFTVFICYLVNGYIGLLPNEVGSLLL